jgi:hypothetical protein
VRTGEVLTGRSLASALPVGALARGLLRLTVPWGSIIGADGINADGDAVGAGQILRKNWERPCRSPRVRPRQPHDVSLACGTQPAYEKLLNRRIRADALTSTPAPSSIHPHVTRRMRRRSAVGLAIGHKNSSSRPTPGLCPMASPPRGCGAEQQQRQGAASSTLPSSVARS